MIMTDTCTKHLVLPIHIGTTILESYIVVLCILTQVISCTHIIFLQNIVKGYITVIGYIGSFLRTLLGGNDDNTIGSLRTIDGCCRSITKHVNRLDIFWRYNRNINSRDSIHYIVRRHGTRTESRSTTKGNGRRTVRIGSRRNHQTRNLTLKHLTWVCEHTLVQIFCLHGSNRRGDILTAHRTITYNYDLIQGRIIFLQNNLTVRTSLYRLRCKSNVRELQLRPRLHIQGIVTIYIGNRTIVSTYLHDAYANKRFAIGIFHGTADLTLCKCECTHQQKGGRKQYSFHASSICLLYYLHNLLDFVINIRMQR